MNVCIDTNILLSFFHLTNEDLGELEKEFFLLQEQQQVKLWVTEQIGDEFKRNREGKIADALKRLIPYVG